MESVKRTVALSCQTPRRKSQNPCASECHCPTTLLRIIFPKQLALPALQAFYLDSVLTVEDRLRVYTSMCEAVLRPDISSASEGENMAAAQSHFLGLKETALFC